MDNIIVVVKIIAGCVLGRGRLLLVAAISRRELMRRVTVYRRLPRIFAPAIRPPSLRVPHFTSYTLEAAAALSRFLEAPRARSLRVYRDTDDFIPQAARPRRFFLAVR